MSDETRPRYPEPPKTDVASVEQSPFKHLIFSMLCSGNSPARVAFLLRQRYPKSALPSDKEVKAYFDAIPPSYFLPLGPLRDRFKSLDVEIDAVGEMARLIMFTKERLDAAMLLQELTPVSERPALAPLLENLTTLLWKQLNTYVKARQSLGELPTEPMRYEDLTERPADLLDLRQLLASRGEAEEDTEDGE